MFLQKVIMIAGKKRAGKDEMTKVVKKYLKRAGYKVNKLSLASALKDLAHVVSELSLKEIDILKNKEEQFIISVDKYETNMIKGILDIFKNYGHLFNFTKDMELDEFKLCFNICKIREDDFSIIEEFDFKGTNEPFLRIDTRKFLQHLNIAKKIFMDEDIWVKILIEKNKHKKGINIISDYRFPNEKVRFISESYIVNTIKVIGKNFFDEEIDLHVSETALNNESFDYVINNMIYNKKSINTQIKAILTVMLRKKI